MLAVVKRKKLKTINFKKKVRCGPERFLCQVINPHLHKENVIIVMDVLNHLSKIFLSQKKKIKVK